MEETEKEARQYLSKIAERLGYVLNPDEKAFDRIAKYLADNKSKHGRYFCPCKQHIPVDPAVDPVCPCPTFKEEIDRDGHCECHVFYSPDAAKDTVKNPGLLATVSCPGWAAKVSKAQLALALSEVPAFHDDRVIVSGGTADDAGIMKTADGFTIVNTVDLLAPVVNDPFTFGKIAAVNSLSDIYAMGGTPLSALNVIGVPGNLEPSALGRILKGGQEAVLEAGAVMLGGHTFQDAEIRYGLAVTGTIDPRRIYTNCDARSGDLLILTKPLGTGTVIQALMSRGVVTESLYRKVTESMLTSNRRASEIMREFDVSACTDITGFGFLGHCLEMSQGSGIGAEIYASKIPAFEKVLELIGDGVTDAGYKMNLNSFENSVHFNDQIPAEYRKLLFSSETSGGLLIAVSPADADSMVESLVNEDLVSAGIVGQFSGRNEKTLEIRL